MKPELIFHATLDNDFAVLGLADADDQSAEPLFFAKVLPPRPALHPANLPPLDLMLTEHLEQQGTWYEVKMANTSSGQVRPSVAETPDQAAMMPFELLLLAYAKGRQDEIDKEQGNPVSHPATLQMLASLGMAAQSTFQSSYGQGVSAPPQPQKSTLQQIVDLLKKQPPPVKALPPPPPEQEQPAAPIAQTDDVFEQEMASLDDFLNEARSKAGGL